MSDKTGISWTDATWNPIRGCSRVSEGCRHCYAEAVAARFSKPGQPYEGLAKIGVATGHHPKWTGEVRFIAEHLADPLRWKRPRRIFVNSMSDLFHEKLTNEQIAAVFGVMAAAPQHTFQVLTKRARRMREWFEWAAAQEPDAPNTCIGIAESSIVDSVGRITSRVAGSYGHVPWPLPNVWLGVSVENQEAADERIPELLRTPAAVRFLSCEPLIGPFDLAAASPNARSLVEDLDWLICGCESGRFARPCSVEWLRSLRDQCAAAEVPFFLKQAAESDMGRCGDADNPNGDDPCGERIRYFVYGPKDSSVSCGCTAEGSEDANGCPPIGFGDGSSRKPGGVIELPYLDGVQHAEFPRP